jgi:hypothetical protein
LGVVQWNLSIKVTLRTGSKYLNREVTLLGRFVLLRTLGGGPVASKPWSCDWNEKKIDIYF